MTMLPDESLYPGEVIDLAIKRESTFSKLADAHLRNFAKKIQVPVGLLEVHWPSYSPGDHLFRLQEGAYLTRTITNFVYDCYIEPQTHLERLRQLRRTAGSKRRYRRQRGSLSS